MKSITLLEYSGIYNPTFMWYCGQLYYFLNYSNSLMALRGGVILLPLSFLSLSSHGGSQLKVLSAALIGILISFFSIKIYHFSFLFLFSSLIGRKSSLFMIVELDGFFSKWSIPTSIIGTLHLIITLDGYLKFDHISIAVVCGIRNICIKCIVLDLIKALLYNFSYALLTEASRAYRM